ncbi:MAG: IPT/TIG domain-containing protein [Labilithrix sp.]|nr:IPT/TIG domain-containing protein [Labilithrix sp.]
MAADAWAQCGAHVGSAAQTATDAYLAYLETQITPVDCPAAASLNPPTSTFSINGCTASNCPTRIKRWARQRQVATCNVGVGAGSTAVVRFHGNASIGTKLEASSFTGLTTATSPAIREAAVAAGQKEVDIAEVNLCMAQRLREHVASADSFFLSAEDLRQLLEVIRERAQIAMVQYALLGRTFTNPDDRAGGPSSPFQAFITLMYWSKRPEAQAPMTKMGLDLAAAVQLHVDTTGELAQLLVRSAAARVGRGGTPSSNPRSDFGAGSWRQRLLALLYGGNPMATASSTAEVDLASVGNHQELLGAIQSSTANSVPWATAWTEDSLGTWSWPNAMAPIGASQKYATAPTPDPHVRHLLALARRADALYLKESNADYISSPGSAALTFRRIDIGGTAPKLWSLVEAWLRTQECRKVNPTCIIRVGDPAMPTAAGYGISLLWRTYGIQPAHATMLVGMLADIVPGLSETSYLRFIFPNFYPPMLVEQQGASHMTGNHRTLSAAEVSARLPGEAGTWYRLDPEFDVLPFGNAERSPLYSWVAPYFLPRSFDKFNVPISQGFGRGDAVKRLGAIGALTASRNLLEDAVSGASSAIASTYLAKVPRVLATITSAIGDRSMSVRPTTGVKNLYRTCGDFDLPPLVPKACPTIIQTAAVDGTTARWNFSVRASEGDSFFDGPASLVIVPFQGGIESAAAKDANYRSFQNATRATLLQSAQRVEVSLPNPTSFGTAKQWDVSVDLPTATVSASVISVAMTLGRPFSVFLKRGAGNETEYQLLAQRLVLAVDIASRPVGSGSTNELVGLPVDGQFIAYGGVLGQIAERAWTTLEDDWSKPAYDGFDNRVDWIPPFDPTLSAGATAEGPAAMYLRNARNAAEEATNAVKNAIDEVMKEQADDAVLASAQRRAAEIVQLEQRALCGDAAPDCDTSTRDFSTQSYVPTPVCASGALCLAAKELRARGLPPTVRLARAVHDHVFDAAPPAFKDYAGGALQKVLIQQWTAMRKLKQAGSETSTGFHAHQSQIAVAEAELAQVNAVQAYECSEQALSDAYFSGFSYPLDRMAFRPPPKGELPKPKSGVHWSAGPLTAQNQACERAELAMGPANARHGAVVKQAWAWLASQTTLVLEAAAALQTADADLAKALAATDLAKAKAELEGSLAAGTLVTKFGAYRRYHSYDIWRARALLESTRRYAVAARRAIEAQFVVDLSEMRSDEPFVAAPATWADEIYEYDLAAPAAVGLLAVPRDGDGIYPNRLIDYVGNLERFVNGYAVARPTAVAQNDDEVIHVSGPDARVDVVIDGIPQRVLSGDVAGWEFMCPNGSGWVQHPGLAAPTANAAISTLCGGVKPMRARVSFSLDPWGRRSGNIAEAPYAKRHNARWSQLAVNLVGTGVRNCSGAPDPNACYANAYLRYSLSHVGPALVTNFDEQWRSMGVPLGSIEGAKALAAEQWLDPTGNGFSRPYVASVARTEFVSRPLGGTYRFELEVTPDVRLDRLDRIQLLARSSYWVKQGQSALPSASTSPILATVDHQVADTAGGDAITITGVDLGGATACMVGGTMATITSNTDTSLSFVMPAKAGGVHDVVVITSGGASNSLPLEAWNPSQIPGIDGYFDSRKGLSLSGATVTAWQEQSRSVAYTAAGTPTRIADAFRPGVPAIRYGAGNDRHSGTARSLTGSSSVFWVGKWTGNSAVRPSFGCARNVVSSISGFTAWGIYGDGLDLYSYAGASQFATRGSALNTGNTLLAGWIHSGPLAKAYVGTTQLGTDVALSQSTTPAWTTVGSSGYHATNGADADIGAVIIVAGVISASDSARLHAWSRAGFGAAP